MTPDAAGIEASLAAGLAAHLPVDNMGGAWCTCGWKRNGTGFPNHQWAAHVAAALLPVVTQAQAEAKVEALRLVRRIEADMSEQAADAWRSADARRGLSDHEALLVHADALTRWSERFRMAFDGEDYRERAGELDG